MRHVIWTGLVAASLVGGCQRSVDVEKMANGALDSVALNDQVDADYDSAAKVVRLSGTVDSGEARKTAVDAVTASIGTYAQVANEIVVEGVHAEAADDLDGGIKERFATLEENEPLLKAHDLDIRVENGVVTMTGSVPAEKDRKTAEGLVRAIPGVKDVVNAVTLDPDKPRERPSADR